MIVHQPTIAIQNGQVTVSARVESLQLANQLPKELYFTLPECFADQITDRTDAFAVALLLTSMRCGEELHLQGALSPCLLEGLESYQELVSAWWPKLFQRIPIHARVLSPSPAPLATRGVGVAFSGGVDSLYALWRALPQNEPIPSARATHGIFLHGFDIPLERVGEYESRRQEYEAMFDRLGLALIPVRTNIRQFLTPHVELNKYQVIPLASAALILSPLLSRMYIPSPGGDHFILPNGTSPIGDHLLSSESLEVVHHMGTVSRMEKVVQIVDWDEAQKNLRVCLEINRKENEINCCRCWKCTRTMVELDLLGRLDRFVTLRSPLTWVDYLRWGRWIKFGFGYEWELLRFSRAERKPQTRLVILALIIGALRTFLLRFLPGWVQRPIQRLVSPPKAEPLFSAVVEKKQTGCD